MAVRLLDKIEVLILRIPDGDIYKNALQTEYLKYRTILEALPKDVTVPQKLYSSIFSLSQRLEYYVIRGKSTNPFLELSPTLSEKITDESEKEEFLDLVKSNSSYIETQKTKLEVLKSYLDNLSTDNTLDAIISTIQIVEREYRELNVYSNMLEKEIAKAKFIYMLKLLYENMLTDAQNLADTFDYDMVLVVYNRYKDSVKGLIADGKVTLAHKISDFLIKLSLDMITNLDFWKVLAQIENPSYDPSTDIIITEENSTIITSPVEQELAVKKKKPNSFLRFFSGKPSNVKKIKGNNYYIIINDSKLTIELTVFKGLYMSPDNLQKLCDELEKICKKKSTQQTINDVILVVTEISTFIIPKTASGIYSIISKISNVISLREVQIQGSSTTHSFEGGFMERLLIEKVTISGGSWLLGAGAFRNCLLLKEVDLSSTQLEKLGDYAFDNCVDLVEVKLPYRVNGYSLGKGLFRGCRVLETVNWPYDVTEIQSETFQGCTKLKTIGYTHLKTIEDRAFEGCESLESISSSSIMRIGERAFYGCKSLTSFSFAKDCRISDYAFALSGLKKLELSVLFKSMGRYCFLKSKLQLVSFTGDLSVPQGTFKDCTSLTTVELTPDITVLSKEAFSGCTALKTIIGPNEFTYIGDECFKGCETLSKILLSKSATYVGKSSFEGCASLTKILYPAVETVETDAFKDCTHIEEFIFETPESILRICDGAFEGCERLRTFTPPPNLKVIGNRAFKGTDIKLFLMPDSVTEIGDEAFCECMYLQKVALSKKLKQISARLFFGCTNLQEIDLSPCQIENILELAFSECESLRKVTFCSNIRFVSHDAFDFTFSIREVVIPEWYANGEQFENESEQYKFLQGCLVHFELQQYRIKEVTLVDNTYVTTVIAKKFDKL